MDEALLPLLERGRTGRVVVLTGAGISAESGIPTFRGPEGYWTVGSTNYEPSEIGTRAAFDRMPREVWRWYLFRATVCRAAEPNEAHRSLARLEAGLGKRFDLVTQNVDGLHLRAGNSEERTHHIHGSLAFVRGIDGHPPGLFPMPSNLPAFARDTPLDDATWGRLVCPDGTRARPHVLWFDEYYDEEHYRATTAENAASEADLLIVIGTSGATTLPLRCAAMTARAGGAIVDVNPNDNPFATFARDYEHGHWVQSSAVRAVPEIVD
ncbi:MAG: Sir2 family NAD-dependent protein deacetylase, partial [Myxococcota bacterium]